MTMVKLHCTECKKRFDGSDQSHGKEHIQADIEPVACHGRVVVANPYSVYRENHDGSRDFIGTFHELKDASTHLDQLETADPNAWEGCEVVAVDQDSGVEWAEWTEGDEKVWGAI